MAVTHRDPAPAVKSAMRTLDVIELIVAMPEGLVAQDIARSLAIPVSSLSYLLSTLVERGYLKRNGRTYLPGAGLERLRLPRRELSLLDKAKPTVKAIRNKLNETVSFFSVDGWELRADITETSDHALRYSINVGEKTPLWCVAAGKAVLARLEPSVLDTYFAEVKMFAFTDATICKEPALRRELERISAQGFATTRDEYTLGISGIGQAILADGYPVAAIGVAMPSVRFDDARRDEISTLLNDAATQLSTT